MQYFGIWKPLCFFFVFQKYDTFWSISQGHFIKHKYLICEECTTTTTYTSSTKFFKAIILEVVSLCHAYFGICCWGIGQKMPRIFGSLVDHSWWDGKLHGCKRPNEKSRQQVQGRISNHHHIHKNKKFWV